MNAFVKKVTASSFLFCKCSDTAWEKTNIFIASKYTLYQQFLQKKARDGEVFCFFSLTLELMVAWDRIWTGL